MTTVGTGKYTYRHIKHWAKMPQGETFGAISGLATDSQDRLYALQQSEPPVLVFDREGKYLSSWGNGAFVRAHYVHIENDIAYVTDTNDEVAMIYTLEGRPIQVLGRRGVYSDTGTDVYCELVPRAAGPFNHPTKLVPGPTGDLFVSDGERNCRVHRFSSDGQLIKSWGEPGKTSPGQFHVPHAIVVDQDGRVYVCDRENACIQVFTSDGEYITSWTDMRPPIDIAIDKDEVFYVAQFSFNEADRYEGYPPPAGTGSAVINSAGRRMIRPGAEPQLSVMDRQGNVLAHWNVPSGHGMCVDSRGDIYLTVWPIPDIPEERSIDKYIRQA